MLARWRQILPDPVLRERLQSSRCRAVVSPAHHPAPRLPPHAFVQWVYVLASFLLGVGHVANLGRGVALQREVKCANAQLLNAALINFVTYLVYITLVLVCAHATRFLCERCLPQLYQVVSVYHLVVTYHQKHEWWLREGGVLRRVPPVAVLDSIPSLIFKTGAGRARAMQVWFLLLSASRCVRRWHRCATCALWHLPRGLCR